MKRNFLWLIVLVSALEAADYTAPPAKTPSSLATNDWIIKPFGFASFLYWNCREGGSEIAVEADFAPLVTPGIYEGGSSESMIFGTTPGFRAGAGFLLPWERTSLGVAYTYLNVKASKNISASKGQVIFPMLANPVAGASVVSKVVAHWNIQFQNVDADFDKRYSVGKMLTLLPGLGVKGAWIDQHRKVSYGGFVGNGLQGTGVSGATYETSDQNDFSGFGLKLGGSSLWNLGYGFRLFGLLKGALLVGDFHVKQSDWLEGQTVTDFSSTLLRIVPTMQFGTGLDWVHAMGACSIEISVAYEAQYWWGQNQFAYFTTASPYYLRQNDDLAFQGLTASVGITF